MKYVKMLGLMAAMVAAMMAFAGLASATTVTSNEGETPTIKAANEGGTVSLHGANGVTVECSSAFEGTVKEHGTGITARVPLFTFSFSSCVNGYEVHVQGSGELLFHLSFRNVSVTLGGGFKMVVTAKSVFGTISCVYEANQTSIGTLTSSATTGGNATLDISATLPRTGGSSLCGSTGTWTGSYVINSPATLNFD